MTAASRSLTQIATQIRKRVEVSHWNLEYGWRHLAASRSAPYGHLVLAETRNLSHRRRWQQQQKARRRPGQQQKQQE